MARMQLTAILLFLLTRAGASNNAASTSGRAGVTPISKVIEMLSGMATQGKQEKQDEAVQYAAYKQFCDGTQSEKKKAVEEATEQIEMLKADIQLAETSSEKITHEIAQLDADVATWTGDEKASTSVRETERKEYMAGHKDYSETIDAIERAVQVLRAQATSTPQVQSAVASLLEEKRLDKAPEVRRVLAAFLSSGSEEDTISPPSAYAYESRSGGIIDLLEKLKDKFTEQRSVLEKEELNKRHAFELLVQDLKRSVANAGDERGAKVQQKTKHVQSVASLKGVLEDTGTTKADDEQYLKQVTATCTQKASDFQDRQQLRADELAAIQKALEILSGDTVQGSYKKYLAAMLQSRRGHAAFVQMRAVDQNPNQKLVAEYLAKKADKINSQVLSALAVRVRDDPFSKVKKMIKDLIVRLMEQANDETQHKGWCDTELAQNEQARKARSTTVERHTSEIDEKESSVAQLSSEVNQLTIEVADLAKSVGEQMKIRTGEKATNEQTIKDSQDAQAALSKALVLLKEFYAKAGDATALLQTQGMQQPTAPPVFEGSYQGMADLKGGVISMLEVIQSDYARLESSTGASEATAAEDYNRLMTESAVLKAQQQKDIEHKTRQKQSLEQALVDLRNDLSSAQKELDAANNYYEKLKPSCLDSGMSLEEREKRRQEEIQSLQEALRILNGEDIAATL